MGIIGVPAGRIDTKDMDDGVGGLGVKLGRLTTSDMRCIQLSRSSPFGSGRVGD